MAKDNIRFLGHVPNDSLPEIYERHDVFILPSRYEPWGLVVEEALFRGLPVIASDKVGSAADMVAALETGAVFPCPRRTACATPFMKLKRIMKPWRAA